MNFKTLGASMLLLFILLWVTVIFGNLILVGISTSFLVSLIYNTDFYYPWGDELRSSFKHALIGGSLFGGWIWLRAKYLERKGSN